jgi:transposase-like protein
MEKKQEAKKVPRIITAERKFEILKDIERCKTIKNELAKHELAQSLYHKWKRQLEVVSMAKEKKLSYRIERIASSIHQTDPNCDPPGPRNSQLPRLHAGQPRFLPLLIHKLLPPRNC